ncbi:MAG: HEAT repeat domain-containing protein [Chloroflexi bacterium]|nr:HEAT repeat domain-containing protein [Chloroflexota bacterium]
MSSKNNTCLSDSDLFRLWNRDVGEKEQATFQGHLASCQACRQRWEEYSADAQLVAETLRKSRAPSSIPVGSCLSEEQVADYVSGVTKIEETQSIDRHLKSCQCCAGLVRSARFFCWQAEHGELLQESPLAAGKLLELVKRAGPSEPLRQALRIAQPGPPVRFADPIRLACLVPKIDAAQRLAAATGEGLSEQVFRQDQPPFEVHLVQFGQELRATIRVGEAESPYADCLAEVRLVQDDRCVLSRIVLIQGGLGRCVIDPSSIEQARPESQAVQLVVQPLLTVGQLAAAGTAAFVPILEQLLGQDDVEIKQAALSMLVLIGGPQATALLKRACEDISPQVRAAAQEGLQKVKSGD